MSDTQPDGYLALPQSGQGRGVLLLHAWWGLNETMRAYCDRLAEAGFVAFAPDLYHGDVVDTIAGAEALSDALDGERARAEIASAVQFLREVAGEAEEGVAVIGFSLGAFFALEVSASEPEQIHSVVVYYGTGPRDYSRSRAAYLGHFAEADEFEPQEEVDALEAALRDAGRPVTFYRYSDTGHWFCEPDRLDAYDEEPARLAWERTVGFLGPGD
jgi:carboxymethylenebutenolidase